MTETTPAAVVTAPAAVAPDPATIVAPVTPAEPTPAKATSLVPGELPETPAPVVASVTPEADDKTAWYLYEGIKGQGEMPSWFLADKYKNVMEQAKAYPEAQKRFGAFTGVGLRNTRSSHSASRRTPEGLCTNAARYSFA